MNFKNYVLFIIFLHLFVFAEAQPEKGKPGSIDSYKAQEYYNVLAENNTIMEGPYELWYKGIKLVSGNFSNNEKVGLWKFNNLKLPYKDIKGNIIDSLSQELYYQGSYKNDKKNGAWKYYLNKKPLCNIYFKDNLRDSTWKSFYQNSQLRFLINYKNGLLNGLYEHFASNGKKIVSKEYSNDSLNGNYIMYNADGEIKIHIEYKMGRPFNVLDLKNKLNGRLDPGTLKDGSGTLKHYDKDDKLYLLETYKNGKKHGLSEKYYTSSGKICEKGTFTNDIKNNDWEYLKSDGTKEKTIIIKDEKNITDSVKKPQTADFVTTYAESLPIPQGGNDEFQSYLESNINDFIFDNSFINGNTTNKFNLPPSKKRSAIEFVISATGKAYHLKFGEGFKKNVQENIKLAFRGMPPWIPAFDGGFPVEYYYSMPVIIEE